MTAEGSNNPQGNTPSTFKTEEILEQFGIFSPIPQKKSRLTRPACVQPKFEELAKTAVEKGKQNNFEYNKLI